MLTLNTFGANFGEPDASPFCVKAMCLLEMSNVVWQNNPGFDSRKAPMQKLPVLVDGEHTIADSDFIRTWLEDHYDGEFDAGLSPVERAQSRALIRLAEEHLYFCLVYERWVIDSNWHKLRQLFFSDMPVPVKWIVPSLVRKSVLSRLAGQGVGKLNHNDMLRRAKLDIEAITRALGSKAFLFGEKATAADASVAPVLAAIAGTNSSAGLSALVSDNIELRRYIDRFRDAAYPH